MKKINNALLIDNDALINMMNAKLIEGSKIATNVNVVTNAKEALRILKKIDLLNLPEFPEIIFLDIDMPVMSGWQFLKEVEKIPLIVLNKYRIILLGSSLDLFQIKKAKSNTMVNDYIPKPLTMKSLQMLRSAKYKPFSICQTSLREI